MIPVGTGPHRVSTMGEMSDLYESGGVRECAPGTGNGAGSTRRWDMERMRRAALGLLATVAVTAAAVLALAGPAAAAPAPALAAPAVVEPVPDPEVPAPDPATACANPSAGEGYAPPGRCELVLVRAAGICLGDAPALDYAVEPFGTPNTTVTITFVNPAGEDAVLSGLPLSGRIYWPGTVIQDGVVVDWPGWTRNPDGTWEEFDAYSFTRPSVRVEFEVNPSVATVVSYPPATSACANPPQSGVLGVTTTSQVLAVPETQSAVLAVTGANSWPLVAVAGAAVLLGAGMVALSVRRGHRAR